MRETITKAVTETVKSWVSEDDLYESLEVDRENVDKFVCEIVQSAMDSTIHEPVQASISRDYERDYYTLCERFKELQEDNLKLNQALINVACKLK